MGSSRHRLVSASGSRFEIGMKKAICWIALVVSWGIVGCHRSHPDSAVDSATGGRKYAIKLSRPSKVGAKFRMHARGERRAQSVITAGTKMAHATNAVEVELQGNVAVLETDALHKISKMSCTVESCQVKSNGISSRWPARGTVIIVERNPARDRFFINGALVPDGPASVLSLVLWLNVMAGDNDALFGTDGMKKVGDSWPYRADRVKNLGPERLGTVRLVGVTNVNGQSCLEIEANLRSTNLDANFNPGSGKVRSVNQEYLFGQLVPVDSSRPHVREIGREQTLVELDVQTAKGPGVKNLAMEVVTERWFEQQ